MVAAQRTNLRPGDYNKGIITLSSNVGAPEQIQVVMTVKPLPPNAGPVLSLIPAVMSFTTTDGNTQPLTQKLTINNPGSQTLYWSLTNNPAIQSKPIRAKAMTCPVVKVCKADSFGRKGAKMATSCSPTFTIFAAS